ncbi:flavin reductase [Azorhizobium oxalatiphilum]|uniref:Flavin reductase n=1 Tax=Azorhizobium oxalatiphilum TaxID=980631 RepID=A0A917FKJ1_9HYPH|nr:flavin reductase family protein [Azorhizobium oxalatiphilum]GGF86755.1 flavin reductase [Azorhizobium oxalatiphilum]
MNAHAAPVRTAEAASPIASPLRQPVFTPPPSPSALAFRGAMRKLAGAVSLVTTGTGESRTGLTATSVSSLSVDPPTLIVCVNRSASARDTLLDARHFAINVLRPHHTPLADRFAGRTGEQGAERFSGTQWTQIETGAPVLADALAVFDCELEEVITRHSHLILLGRVVAARITENADPLLYWSGAYRTLEG